MNATKIHNGTDERFTLELSFVEMHIIMQAMNAYAHKTGYGQWTTATPNQSHAEAAEELHDSLTEIYCQ